MGKTERRAWTSGEAFGNADFADKGQIRFTRAATKLHGDVSPLLVVHHKDRPTDTVILRSVVDSGPDNVPIYVAPTDYEKLKGSDAGDNDQGSIALEFKAAGRLKAIVHPSSRGALGDALVTFVSALLLAGCAIANVWFSHKADTSPWIFRIAIIVLVVTVLAGIWKVWRDIGKLYK